MDVITYQATGGVPTAFIDRLSTCDWGAGRHLAGELGHEGFFCPEDLLLCAVEGDELLAVATIARRGYVPDPELGPWVGFVYTFPESRGKGCMRQVMERAAEVGRERGLERLHLSAETSLEGFYERFGFVAQGTRIAFTGEEVELYELPL